MKIIASLLIGILLSMPSFTQESQEIRLLIRGDDIGSFHAANLGCIESYRNGIMRSVEIMVPCPWYPEAVQMLNENPELDVGVHLVLTSEWDAMKWRPLTGISTLTDEQGYFFPMVWPNENFPASKALQASEWQIQDVEKELTAQIELARKDIANLTHISTHMGFTSADPSMDSLVNDLARKYDLAIDAKPGDLKRLDFRRNRNSDYESQARAFAGVIRNLTSGTYLYVEHPAKNTAEMETIGHKGYEKVGNDREGVTFIFTSELVKKAIEEKNIQLIGYGDLKR